MFHFYTPWKRHEIKDFPTFSGGIEMEYRREMGSRLHDLDFKNDDAGQKDLLIHSHVWDNFWQLTVWHQKLSTEN